MMAMQMHRMNLAASVRYAHPHEVPVGNNEHRYVGEGMTINGPQHFRSAIEKAWPTADGVLKSPVGAFGIER